MTQEERSYWLGFSLFPGIGPVRFNLLREYFGSAKAAWHAPEKELIDIGLGEKLTSQFAIFRRDSPIIRIIGLLEQKHIRLVTSQDSEYPSLLNEIPDPPFLLYVRSDMPVVWNTNPCVGVVGTRKVTAYGKEITRQIVEGLVRAGVTVVSGLAYGVDTIAHQTAVDLGGSTIAVLGCGVDVIHPATNATLYWQIVKKAGAVISEYPPGQYASKGLFPARNRIISGMSLGIVVTEGAVDSGSLITASYAAKQGREVFAVPGPINAEYSQGPVMLIKNGAKVVTKVEDILEELHLETRHIRPSVVSSPQNLSSEEQTVFNLLRLEPLHVDEIVRKSCFSMKIVGSILTMLEMKQLIVKASDGMYNIKL